MTTPFIPRIPGCGAKCRYAWCGHTDAAKRMADNANLAWMFHGWDSVGKWKAFALADGSGTHDLYDHKRDAIRHVPDEFLFTFIKLHPGGMNVCEAEIMLDIARKAYDSGFRLVDPDSKTGGPDIIPRIGHDRVNAQISALTHRKAGG